MKTRTSQTPKMVPDPAADADMFGDIMLSWFRPHPSRASEPEDNPNLTPRPPAGDTMHRQSQALRREVYFRTGAGLAMRKLGVRDRFPAEMRRDIRRARITLFTSSWIPRRRHCLDHRHGIATVLKHILGSEFAPSWFAGQPEGDRRKFWKDLERWQAMRKGAPELHFNRGRVFLRYLDKAGPKGSPRTETPDLHRP